MAYLFIDETLGTVSFVTDALGQESVSDLPGEHCGILPLVICDFIHTLGVANFWFGPPNNSGLNTAGFHSI